MELAEAPALLPEEAEVDIADQQRYEEQLNAAVTTDLPDEDDEEI